MSPEMITSENICFAISIITFCFPEEQPNLDQYHSAVNPITNEEFEIDEY